MNTTITLTDIAIGLAITTALTIVVDHAAELQREREAKYAQEWAELGRGNP